MRASALLVAVLGVLAIMVSACAPAAAPTAQPPAPPAAAQGTTASTAPQATPAGRPATVQVGKAGSFSAILVDGKGMSLYIYTKDTPGTSTCYGKCANAWPPLLTSGTPVPGTGLDLSKCGTLTRTDGTTQVTYNGWPLYYFAKDKQPGDVTGQGVGSVWYLISPSGDKIASGG